MSPDLDRKSYYLDTYIVPWDYVDTAYVVKNMFTGIDICYTNHIIWGSRVLKSNGQGSWSTLNSLLAQKLPDSSNFTLIDRLAFHKNHKIDNMTVVEDEVDKEGGQDLYIYIYECVS